MASPNRQTATTGPSTSTRQSPHINDEQFLLNYQWTTLFMLQKAGISAERYCWNHRLHPHTLHTARTKPGGQYAPLAEISAELINVERQQAYWQGQPTQRSSTNANVPGPWSRPPFTHAIPHSTPYGQGNIFEMQSPQPGPSGAGLPYDMPHVPLGPPDHHCHCASCYGQGSPAYILPSAQSGSLRAGIPNYMPRIAPGQTITHSTSSYRQGGSAIRLSTIQRSSGGAADVLRYMSRRRLRPTIPRGGNVSGLQTTTPTCSSAGAGVPRNIPELTRGPPVHASTDQQKPNSDDVMTVSGCHRQSLEPFDRPSPRPVQTVTEETCKEMTNVTQPCLLRLVP